MHHPEEWHASLDIDMVTASLLGLEVSVCNGRRIAGAWRVERLCMCCVGVNTEF